MRAFYIVGIFAMIVNILIAANEQNPHSASGWIVAMLFLIALLLPESKNIKPHDHDKTI